MIETLTKLTMLGLFAAATPVETTDASLWANWGLAGVVVAYVIHRDWQREKRLSSAIEGQQRWIRETLVQTLERNAVAMERMLTWLEDADLRRAPTKRLHAVEDDDGYHG
jgi:hypothetical protein